MSLSIGEFYMVHYQTMLNKYVYHRMLLWLLGKHEWNNIRGELFSGDNNAFMKERDYAEAQKA